MPKQTVKLERFSNDGDTVKKHKQKTAKKHKQTAKEKNISPPRVRDSNRTKPSDSPAFPLDPRSVRIDVQSVGNDCYFRLCG
ncbi:hypothetical protein A2U01_0013975 [Trifolium medium]|uniref:Uncharacterized protein n=1 Tax=Trifolium medium TaxID=97028 RepID=A0A392N244_9FABA|nr:hypothetical protein [Trifolium medium]